MASDGLYFIYTAFQIHTLILNMKYIKSLWSSCFGVPSWSCNLNRLWREVTSGPFPHQLDLHHYITLNGVLAMPLKHTTNYCVTMTVTPSHAPNMFSRLLAIHQPLRFLRVSQFEFVPFYSELSLDRIRTADLWRDKWMTYEWANSPA